MAREFWVKMRHEQVQTCEPQSGVRAFGCLVEELLSLVSKNELTGELRSQWQQLVKDCTLPEVKSRPGFSDILAVLDRF